MRYTRQVNEVAVQIPNGRFTGGDRARIENAFNAKYEEMYGIGAGHAEAGIEVISIAVDAIGATVKPMLRTHPVEGPDASAARKSTRRAYFTGANPGYHDAAIYDYTRLKVGNVLSGPAIIETPFTTVVVPDRQSAEVDQYLNIVLRR
jgi:N-methylhydantoinase A